MRPRYGSVVVLTTSATSGPSGSQPTVPAGAPSGRATGGQGPSNGAGKALISRSSSSLIPRPGSGAAQSTRGRAPRAPAVSGSGTRSGTVTGSPARYWSTSASSSLSAITASTSSARSRPASASP